MADHDPPVIPPPASPRRRSALRVVLIAIVLAIVLAVLVAALLLCQAHSWLKRSVETSPASWPSVRLKDEEIVSLNDRWLRAQADLKANRAPTLSLTAPELNYIFEMEREKKLAQRQAAPEEAIVAFEGDRTVLMFSQKAAEGGYLNVRVSGDLSVKDGQVSARLDSVELGGNRAPAAVMLVLRSRLQDEIRKKLRPDDPANPFYPVRSLRREGDKAVMVLDPARHAEREATAKK